MWIVYIPTTKKVLLKSADKNLLHLEPTYFNTTDTIITWSESVGITKYDLLYVKEIGRPTNPNCYKNIVIGQPYQFYTIPSHTSGPSMPKQSRY